MLRKDSPPIDGYSGIQRFRSKRGDLFGGRVRIRPVLPCDSVSVAINVEVRTEPETKSDISWGECGSRICMSIENVDFWERDFPLVL